MQESHSLLSGISKTENVFDMVKIKVHLAEHFYIFSRFLISRMLTLSRVKKLDAIQIAKDIKKSLIDSNSLDITQQELESLIFSTMHKFGYHNSIVKYQMVSNFYRNRTPLVIIIFGAPCIGKSMLANQLAERLNVSNVLQTDIVQTVMLSINADFFNQKFDNDEFDRNLYSRNCSIIRKGVSTDIIKCLSEGKAVIIEGVQALPDHYLSPDVPQNHDISILENYIENGIKLKKIQRKDLTLFNSNQTLQQKFKICYPQTNDQEDNKFIKELSGIDQEKALVIGFLPVVNRQDHLYNIQNNLSKKVSRDQVEARLVSYQLIQKELLKQRSKCVVFPINLHNLEESLDTMQDLILQKILEQQE